MANPFSEGLKAGLPLRRENPMDSLIKRLDESRARVLKEQQEINKEARSLKDALIKLGMQHEYQKSLLGDEMKLRRESQEKRQKKLIDIEKVKGEERRKTLTLRESLRQKEKPESEKVSLEDLEKEINPTSETTKSPLAGTPFGAALKSGSGLLSLTGNPIVSFISNLLSSGINRQPSGNISPVEEPTDEDIEVLLNQLEK